MKSISEHEEAPQPTNLGVRYLTPEQGREILDRQARCYFGMSGEEFIRAYEAGELADHPNESDVVYVALLIPLVRP